VGLPWGIWQEVTMKKVELLAPAGNLEKLKIAFTYGADAVYAGGERYGLRAYADNFNMDELREGVRIAHKIGKKVYLTINIIPHNDDLEGMEEYVEEVLEIGVDGLIVSDPGVYTIVRNVSGSIDVHISTQANVTNWRSALYWYNQGANRIILARELSLDEICEIREKTPENLNLEVFVHGAMCISYSGRCLLSSYMAGRDSNRGLCAHPCRWKYYLTEEKRPGQYFPVFEDDRGTYIFNSKDLCMIQYLPELIKTGISSMKIEGRMKSSFYVATVVKAYREAIDSYYEDPGRYVFNPAHLEEVSKASHREFTTGFYFGRDAQGKQVYDTASYIQEYDFLGIVKGYDPVLGCAVIEQRNRIDEGDELEIVPPRGPCFTHTVNLMFDNENNRISSAPHAQMTVFIPFGKEIPVYSILRRKSKPV
jgi:putative protease